MGRLNRRVGFRTSFLEGNTMGNDTRSQARGNHRADDSTQSRATARRTAGEGPSSDRPSSQHTTTDRISTERAALDRLGAERRKVDRAPGDHGSSHLDRAVPQNEVQPSRSDEASLQWMESANGPSALDETQRREMIATSAYLRAERRGFEDGSDVEDWLAAEAEVDAWLNQIDRGLDEPPLFEE